jgi:ribonuclease E
MGLIIRTAGASRTKVEIKRDYEYLLRMWENIRETTLQSIAPALIYAEEDLVKRAIRDMFDKDLEGIVVEGEAGYREARDFMRMLMPSQAKKIQAYREPTPLFVKYRIEDQLAQIHQPTVALKSGGYIVINQTEALVAVDVNSGRSTRERNIEATALKTNLEAAEETARQLRLRDLAGLIVIDFIDMEESKNNRAVEKKLKDALKDDRARIQVGKISPFGLMEISRQRRRSGVLEGTTHVCEHCQGTGRIRSVESSALAALRTIEVEAAKGIPGAVTIRLPTAIALYVLNEKRVYLARLEQTHDLIITIATDDKLGHTDVVIERTELREGAADRELDYQPPVRRRERLPAPNLLPEPEDVFEPPVEEDEVEEDEDVVDTDVPAKPPRRAETADEADARGRKRRRRRGGRRDDRDDAEPRPDAAARSEPADEDDEDGDVFGATDDVPGESESDARRRRRRRGRRGGRRLREEGRPLDPYAWVHPHGGRNRPHPADDPYAWRDPFAAPHQEDRGFEPRPDRAPLKIVEPALTPVAVAVADPYVWQDGEAPSPASIDPADEPINGRRRERIRRGRGRRTRGPDRLGGVPEAQSPEEIQTAGPAAVDQIEHSIVVEAPSLVPEIAPEAVPAAANVEVEPVVVITAEPPPPPEPDPAEILAPPATPRRGWWRRG